MFLAELNDGDFGIIEELPKGIAYDKLLEQGLCKGTEFEKISGSVLGNIVTIGVGERYFAITNDIAEAVRVMKR